MPLTLRVRHCDLRSPSRAHFVRIAGKSIAAVSANFHARERVAQTFKRMRKRVTLQRRAAHLGVKILARRYQSELFERGFGYLSDGGVSMGQRDPRLRK